MRAPPDGYTLLRATTANAINTKGNPGKINMASAGAGGGDHMCGELFKMMTGVTMTGVDAPKNVPTEIVGRLNEEINAVLSDPKMRARIADLGGTSLVGSPAGFEKLIAADTEKWGKVVRAANPPDNQPHNHDLQGWYRLALECGLPDEPGVKDNIDLLNELHRTHYTRYPQDGTSPVPDASAIADGIVDHLIFTVTQSMNPR